jgi:hypothetical protein
MMKLNNCASEKIPPAKAGARATARMSDGSVQTAEVHSGGGYLSQSVPIGYFSPRKAASIESIEVRWPDGAQTVHENDGWQGSVELSP